MLVKCRILTFSGDFGRLKCCLLGGLLREDWLRWPPCHPSQLPLGPVLSGCRSEARIGMPPRLGGPLEARRLLRPSSRLQVA